jgi:YVTN family beta-propeller protein
MITLDVAKSLFLGALMIPWVHGAGAAVPVAEQLLPTGQVLTPTVAPGARFTTLNPHLADAPRFVAGQSISEALSPDRKTLLVLTSGYNRRRDRRGHLIPGDSQEYVFVFDVAAGVARGKQVLQVPNTYVGIAFAPSGERFVVSGGVDDTLHVFDRVGSRWRENGSSPIKLGHTSGIGIDQKPMAQGVAVTSDGSRAMVANRYNASVTVVDLRSATVVKEVDLRPGAIDPSESGTAGGEYPAAVCIDGSETAFVSSERDREIVVVDLGSQTVAARVPVSGNPNRMILNRDASRLFVALDNADVVAVIDTQRRVVIDEIQTVAPAGMLRLAKRYRGASPNAMALAADEKTLFVTNRGTNSVAVIDNDDAARQVRGLIPTGWYPSDLVVGPAEVLYIVNTQSVPGPNGGNCLGYQTLPCPVKHTPVRFAPNEYILDLSKGGLLSLPLPRPEVLQTLTRQVAANNRFESANRDSQVMEALHARIKHVIYIIKENRTYDQVLGDIGRGNSDPHLAEFPFTTTPNQHNLADRFVLLDSFYDPGNVSGNGWPWSVSARESDAGAKMVPVTYAKRGGSYDWESTNSNINVGLAGSARLAANPMSANRISGKLDPDELPGTNNVAAPDGPDGEVQQGYLWNAAIRAGLAVRNYGFMIDVTRYGPGLLASPSRAQFYIPLETDPASKNLTVAYAANPELVSRTDGFFRGFDAAFPDTFREREWAREFREFETNGNLPALSLVRFMADHTGSYSQAIAGLNTPELQVADNDFAVGMLVEAVAHSVYAKDTLIFIVEDDAQDGPDHVDAHRSTAFVVGPYVKHGAIVSRRFTTINMLRTITDVLGIDHLSLFDATQSPMADVFDLEKPDWDYTAEVSGLLKSPGVTLPIPTGTKVAGAQRRPTHGVAYWAKRTAHMDFAAEDRVDAADYNRILWKGLMGGRPYPAAPRASVGAARE